MVGFPRDNWLNQGKNQYLYASTATTRNKDTYFDSVLNAIVTSWAVCTHVCRLARSFKLILGCRKGKDSQDSNLGRTAAYGDRNLCLETNSTRLGQEVRSGSPSIVARRLIRRADPPHEAPGWYDLYDTDYTMEIIEKYVIFVKTLIGHGIGCVHVLVIHVSRVPQPLIAAKSNDSVPAPANDTTAADSTTESPSFRFELVDEFRLLCAVFGAFAIWMSLA